MKRIRLTVLLLAALLLWGCAPAAPTEPDENQSPAVTVPEATVPLTEPETIPAPAFSVPVETPCGTLYLPDNWDMPIQTQTTLGDPMVISFWAEDVKLYELTFSEAPGEAVGMVNTEDGPIYVGMRIPPLDGEANLLLAMQESVNDLLAQLPLMPVPETPAETQPVEEVLVETPYGVLRFPGKWRDCLMTEQDESLVDFYAVLPGREPVLLFTVAFGTSNGHLSGVLTAENGNQTDIAIVIHALELTGEWTDGEQDTIFAMQEDTNYLLAALER